VDIQIFQGDDEDALNNLLVGDFQVEGLTRTENLNEVLCRMSLDVDGILHVSAIEKRTGKSKQVTIARALQAKSEGEIEAARRRVEELFTTREQTLSDFEDVDLDTPEDEDEEGEVIETHAEPVEVQHTNGKAVPIDATWAGLRHEAVDVVRRSRALLERMHADDKAETTALQDAIENAVADHDSRALGEAVRSLKELLFFVEGA
jgi:molecular chaperone DnaK (HSP70)